MTDPHWTTRAGHRAGPMPPMPAGGADVLAIGFAVTLAMWAAGYVARMPGLVWPSWLVGAVLLTVLLAGGFVAGRATGRGWLGGLAVGLVVGFVNLLIVAGTLRGQGGAAPTLWAWVPGTLIGTALVTALAAALGARFPEPPAKRIDWTHRFAIVAMLTTALVLLAGGLVTGREAGLAVPDWPRSYGYHMLLYPLARMTGNIYYEHTHRLVGLLVGVTTIVLALHLWRHEPRRWMKWLALAAVLTVSVQGVFGGLRVALAEAGSGVSVAAAEHETAASTALRVVHGVFGQMFFALMASIAACTSPAWRRGEATRTEATGTERGLSVTLLVVLIGQLVLGALVRHLGISVLPHIGLGMVVTLLALVVGMRCWGLHGASQPALRKLGIGLMLLVVVQLVLGFGAWLAVNLTGGAAQPGPAELALTTIHQLNGAALLGSATVLLLLTGRLLRRPATSKREQRTPDTAAEAG